MAEFSSSDINALLRIVNSGKAAEGSLVPPRQSGTGRIPVVRRLQTAKIEALLGSTIFTLTWEDPEGFDESISNFNVYAQGLDADKQLQGPYSCRRSPAVLTVKTKTASPITFYVQTVLKNGQVSEIQDSPSCTGSSIVSWGGSTIQMDSGVTFQGTTNSVQITDSYVYVVGGYFYQNSDPGVGNLFTGGLACGGDVSAGGDTGTTISASGAVIVNAHQIVGSDGNLVSANGFSGTVASPSSITVVNGIVTACS